MTGENKKSWETEDNKTSEDMKKPGGVNSDLGGDKKKVWDKKSSLNSLFLSGNCPDVSLMSGNIDGSLFAGDWYTQRTINVNCLMDTKCFHTAAKWDDATKMLFSSQEMRLEGRDYQLSGIKSKLLG